MKEKEWYVVYTLPRWEKKVAANLTELGYENYCPLNKVVRKWSDRKKMVMEPLFKGYVFVKVAEAAKWDIRKVNGIINFVFWLGKPAKVKEEEITVIKKFLLEFEDVKISEPLKMKDKVFVKQGVMMDYKGVVVEVLGNRAKVAINSLGLELFAIFEQNNLHRI
ncbi:MAG: UpxY family transcription antiterminator [Ferruginibacter sp.]|nr:UpxY family transcription antiterminator [Ferruginibacter sp.]